MRVCLIALLVAAAARGQILIDRSRIPPSIRNMEKAPSEKTLRCRVIPIRPELNFDFRFQAGYILRVPMQQYEGAGHQWAVLARVTPEGGGAPVYLGSRYPLPNVPKTKAELEVGGGFLVGEGKYHVDWKLFDETGRTCHAGWNIEVKRTRKEHDIQVGIPPKTIRQFSYAGRSTTARAADAPGTPISIMLHAAPVNPMRTWLNARDRLMLVGLLSSLMEHLPSRQVRLVVFSLDQQKEIYRKENFLAPDISEVFHALDNLELGKVDVEVLQNRKGHVKLLAGLLNDELAAGASPRTVLVLGPQCRFLSHPSAEELESASGPKLFYFEYQPAYRMARATLPDSIAATVHMLKGKTLVIRTPVDFARAIDQVKQGAEQ